jgi:hypothetical protein
MSKPRRTPVDKLLSYSWVRIIIGEPGKVHPPALVTAEEAPLITKLVSNLTKELIEASSHLPVPFLHALAHYADSPRAFHILTIMRNNPLCSTYFENPAYCDGCGNTVLANLCSRAHSSLPDNPVRQLVEQLGGKPTPADGCTGVVKDYIK